MTDIARKCLEYADAYKDDPADGGASLVFAEAAVRITELEVENKRLTAMVANAQHALDEVGAGIARRVAEEREACAETVLGFARTQGQAVATYLDCIAVAIRTRPAP